MKRDNANASLETGEAIETVICHQSSRRRRIPLVVLEFGARSFFMYPFDVACGPSRGAVA